MHKKICILGTSILLIICAWFIVAVAMAQNPMSNQSSKPLLLQIMPEHMKQSTGIRKLTKQEILALQNWMVSILRADIHFNIEDLGFEIVYVERVLANGKFVELSDGYTYDSDYNDYIVDLWLTGQRIIKDGNEFVVYDEVDSDIEYEAQQAVEDYIRGEMFTMYTQ